MAGGLLALATPAIGQRPRWHVAEVTELYHTRVPDEGGLVEIASSLSSSAVGRRIPHPRHPCNRPTYAPARCRGDRTLPNRASERKCTDSNHHSPMKGEGRLADTSPPSLLQLANVRVGRLPQKQEINKTGAPDENGTVEITTPLSRLRVDARTPHPRRPCSRPVLLSSQ